MVNNKALRIKLNILESILPAKRSSAVHDVPHRRRDPLVGIAAVDVVPQSRGTGLVSEDDEAGDVAAKIADVFQSPRKGHRLILETDVAWNQLRLAV